MSHKITTSSTASFHTKDGYPNIVVSDDGLYVYIRFSQYSGLDLTEQQMDEIVSTLYFFMEENKQKLAANSMQAVESVES